MERVHGGVFLQQPLRVTRNRFWRYILSINDVPTPIWSVIIPSLPPSPFERVGNARGRAVAAPLENVAHQAVRGSIIRLRAMACLVRIVFRFRHLRLVAAPFGANVGTIRNTSKLMILL